MKVCFIGLGYIGLPTAIIAAKHGLQVAGTDINPDIVAATNEGRLHIVEPEMDCMLKEVVANGLLKAYATPQLSDAYFIVVPTPFKGNHEPDISYVESATLSVLPLLTAALSQVRLTNWEISISKRSKSLLMMSLFAINAFRAIGLM